MSVVLIIIFMGFNLPYRRLYVNRQFAHLLFLFDASLKLHTLPQQGFIALKIFVIWHSALV